MQNFYILRGGGGGKAPCLGFQYKAEGPLAGAIDKATVATCPHLLPALCGHCLLPPLLTVRHGYGSSSGSISSRGTEYMETLFLVQPVSCGAASAPKCCCMGR